MHSLRSRGDISFEEISLTIPCIEMAYDGGVRDLQADQGHRPRCFKTHFWYRDCPKGGRYIVVVRGMCAHISKGVCMRVLSTAQIRLMQRGRSTTFSSTGFSMRARCALT